MTNRVWYRSLYWRIGLGLIAFLALMLAAQGLLFIWMTDRIAGSVPARSPRRLAVIVASDLGAALTRDPLLDLDEYLRDQYGHVFQPVIALLSDGQVISNHGEPVSEPFVASLRAQARRFAAGRRLERDELFEDEDVASDSPIPRPLTEFAPIVVEGVAVGIVAVPLTRPPFSVLIRELGPRMALAGGLLLAAGGSLIAFFIFGPPRRRLRQLQDATERFGGGDLAARAPEHGGDEVADLAQSFNRMAADLSARARALEQSDRARRQLLADVSHELMTPLTAMRGYIETLRMEAVAVDGATRQRYLGIVDDETRRMERIIGDLLDLARLEGGGGTFHRERVDVAALFERVAARHERELEERHVTLLRHVDPDATQVAGDADRLEQALQNLAANALRHTPDGGEIALRATRAGNAIALTVRDNGPGIPADHLPLIFDRFYKVDAARRTTGGSGLGLSIVKAIVERHGGTIAARNDGGAMFEMTLPYN